MHPNLYLRTLWRAQFRTEVFVAMSFADLYQCRFTEIIEPAIKATSYHGTPLRANRVDLSKTGDSILTDIIDGIAHSLMVLADVSVVGCDAKTGQSYRNGNVMYEVGLALACRQSAEVLLIRDDKDPFLFDVSTVPHKHLDFSDADSARASLTEELMARLREIDHVRDARIKMAVASLTTTERALLAGFAKYGMDSGFWMTQDNLESLTNLPRLLDKQLIRAAGVTDQGQVMFTWTEMGRTLADNLESLVPVQKLPPMPVEGTEKLPDSTEGVA